MHCSGAARRARALIEINAGAGKEAQNARIFTG
jgi:hypothetical protein